MAWLRIIISGVYVTFQLWANVPPGYIVCLTGNTHMLGDWNPYGAIILQRQENPREWKRQVALRRFEHYSYRFFVCKPLWNPAKMTFTRDGKFLEPVTLSIAEGISIMYWESSVVERKLQTGHLPIQYSIPTKDVPVVVSFQSWSNGWLVGITQIRLRLKGKTPIQLKNMANPQFELYIKCLPVDFSDIYREFGSLEKIGTNPETASLLSRFVSVASLPLSTFMKKPAQSGVADATDTSFQPPFATDVSVNKLDDLNCYTVNQSKTGIAFTNGQFLTFTVDATAIKRLGFRIEFYIGEKDSLEFAGFSCVLPVTTDIQTTKTVPIFGRKCQPVGDLNLDYLVITPLPHVKQDMKIGYQNYWKWGVRGAQIDKMSANAGQLSNTKKVCVVRDNTMASLRAAAETNVDFVAFAVQMCADQVPVVYHKFQVLLKGPARSTSQFAIYKTAIKDLTLTQLSSAKMSQRKVPGQEDIPPNSGELTLFPTLRTVLMNLEPTMGCIIEVKYPQTLEVDNKPEVDNYFNHNATIDTILRIIFDISGCRKIVLTSSNPDTCTMLQKKQNRYPVIFRTYAGTNSRPMYEDDRTKSFDTAVQFALNEHLLGLNLSAQAVLKDMTLIQKVLRKNLVIFVWDNDGGSTADAEYLCRNRVDAVVTHHIKAKQGEGQLPYDLLIMPTAPCKKTALASELVTRPMDIPEEETAVAEARLCGCRC